MNNASVHSLVKSYFFKAKSKLPRRSTGKWQGTSRASSIVVSLDGMKMAWGMRMNCIANCQNGRHTWYNLATLQEGLQMHPVVLKVRCTICIARGCAACQMSGWAHWMCAERSIDLAYRLGQHWQWRVNFMRK